MEKHAAIEAAEREASRQAEEARRAAQVRREARRERAAKKLHRMAMWLAEVQGRSDADSVQKYLELRSISKWRDSAVVTDFDPAQRAEFTQFCATLSRSQQELARTLAADAQHLEEWMGLAEERARLEEPVPASIRGRLDDHASEIRSKLDALASLQARLADIVEKTKPGAWTSVVRGSRGRAAAADDEADALDPAYALCLLAEAGRSDGRLPTAQELAPRSPVIASWSSGMVGRVIVIGVVAAATVSGLLFALGRFGGAPILAMDLVMAGALASVILDRASAWLRSVRLAPAIATVTAALAEYESARGRLVRAAARSASGRHRECQAALQKVVEAVDALDAQRAAIAPLLEFEGDPERGGKLRAFASDSPATASTINECAASVEQADEFPDVEVPSVEHLLLGPLDHRDHDRGCPAFEIPAAVTALRDRARDDAASLALEQHTVSEGRRRTNRAAVIVAVLPAIAWTTSFALAAKRHDTWSFSRPQCWMDGANLPTEHLEHDCLRGDAVGCLQLGIRRRFGGPGVRDLQKAYYAFQSACGRRSTTGCSYLGTMLMDGLGTSRDVFHARHFLTNGCDHGDLVGCDGLGVLLSNENGGSATDAAKSLFRRACEGGEFTGCTNLAVALLADRAAAPETVAEAAGLLERACASDGAIGCGPLGDLYLRGRGVPANPHRAMELYRRGCSHWSVQACFRGAAEAGLAPGEQTDLRAEARRMATVGCDLGHQATCLLLGSMHQIGIGGPVDEGQAFGLIRQVCLGETRSACGDYGAMLAMGRGTTADPEAGFAILREACEVARDRDACRNLAALYSSGTGTEVDLTKASQALGAACDLNLGEGCAQLADLLTRGPRFLRDRDRAAALRTRACELGYAAACSGGQ